MDKTKSGSGIGLLGMMFLIFLVLKLCGVISWSWWWVTAPLWGPFAIAGTVVIVVVGVAMIASKEKRR